jgi:hypothetical protein
LVWTKISQPVYYKIKQRSLHQGASIGIDIYKGLQNQTH